MFEKQLNDNNSILSWSSDKLHRLFINNLGKIYLLFLFLAIAISIIENTMPIGSILIFLLILIAMGIIIESFFKKVAYELIFFPDRNELRFKMYRSHKVINLHAQCIQKIIINGYVIFEGDGIKIIFGGSIDDTLLITLSRIKKIKWGSWCFLLGPSKRYRENY
jgi:hypothetical protein